MLLSLARRRRVLFVSGKGGVGKTSIASALALARARDGVRVLLVSTDPAHNLGHAWDTSLSDTASRVWSGEGGVAGCVDAIEIDPQATVDRHLAGVRDSMRRLLPERLHGATQRHLDLAREAPGTHESAVLERIAECVEIARDEYDLVVFDTAPSGHTLRLMALPEQLTAWTESLLANRDRSERFGAALRGLGGSDAGIDQDAELRRLLVRRRERFAQLRDTVRAESTSFVLVLAAERLPVLETLDLHRQLTELGIDTGAFVVNRRSPTDSGDFLASRHAAEEQELTAVRDRLDGAAMVEVPLLAESPVGADGLLGLADRFR